MILRAATSKIKSKFAIIVKMMAFPDTRRAALSRSSISQSMDCKMILAGFIFFLVLNMALWFYLRPIRPNMGIVPPLPSERMVQLLSFGDKQLYFRLASFRLQNAGDTFGRATPYKDYNYALLEQWFLLLDNLDALSNITPSMAGYLFGQSQEPLRDVPYIVRYLESHYDRNPQTKWWWLSQAVYLANHKLKDKDLALRLAYKLGTTEADVPLWARQMPAFILEQRGEHEQALLIIQGILKNHEDISEDELRFMNIFIKDRLKLAKELTEPNE